MKKPHVSIILLNWNSADDTIDCLNSLQSLDYENYSIIVVDNASSDGSIESISAAYPEIQILRNSLNAGFAGGNNVGIKFAIDKGTDYIWLLNNDTMIDPGALTPLLNLLYGI